MSNYSEIGEQGGRRICNLENRTINGATYQPKQSKNQQNGKNCETCALQLYFPTKWLIRVRAFGFGRGPKKF